MPSLRRSPLPLFATGLLAMALVACHSSGSSSASGSSSGDSSAIGSLFSSTRQVQIMDPALNMVAYTLTIPSYWNFQGQVMTNPTCGSAPAIVAYRVWSNDLQYGVQRMPEIGWDTKEDPRAIVPPMCKQMDAMSAAAYAGVVVPTVRPNSTVESIGPAPEASTIAAGLFSSGSDGVATETSAFSPITMVALCFPARSGTAFGVTLMIRPIQPLAKSPGSAWHNATARA